MPNQITDKVVSAFLSGKTMRIANMSTDGIHLKLQGRDIAKIEDGSLWITNAGWNNQAVYDNLNALPNVNVNSNRGKLYLNNVKWDGTWISIGPIQTMEQRMKSKNQTNERRQAIKRIVTTLIREEVKRALSIKKKQIKEQISVDKSDPKNIETGVSNIFLKGCGYDVNGNMRIIAGLPNDRGISIQTNNGAMRETDSILRNNGGRYAKLHKLSDDDIRKIGVEVTNYIEKYGTGNTKKKLKVYGGSKAESQMKSKPKLRESTTIDTNTLKQYIATALWSSTDGDDGNLDDNYSISDLAPETLKKAKADLESFVADVEKEGLLEPYLQEFDMTDLAHDFWLTRNGHGAGFWDRSYDNDEEGNLGDKLTEIAKKYREQDWYVGDDGKIYI
jgi:hypothetical protein